MSITDGFEHIVRQREPLAPYTWLRLGGLAEYFAEPTSYEELQSLVQRFREHELPVRLLGGGSNLLVRDEGTPGLVIHLSAPVFCQLNVEGNRLRAGGGVKLSHLISTAIREGLSGPEQLVGVPGTVGGALHGNTGTHGGDIGQWTREASVMTRSGEIAVRQRDELTFAYRQSSLDELVILEAQLECEPEDPQQLAKRMQKLWIVKKANQPTLPQCMAWIYKDPGHITAGDLIEQAGLRGTRVGQVEISDRDANFFVANPGATSEDVLRLIELVKTQVADRTGVELETGIDIW